MIRNFNALKVAVFGLVLTGCAPPGQGALGYRDIDWPRADHLMTFSENREIEVLLGRLGYMRGGADGQISTTTRTKQKRKQFGNMWYVGHTFSEKSILLSPILA